MAPDVLDERGAAHGLAFAVQQVLQHAKLEPGQRHSLLAEYELASAPVQHLWDINAQLRRESGAAINADEYAKADKQYFPQPGDDPETIKQKALNRKLAVEGMVRGAGPTYQPSPSVPKGPKPLEGAERESLLFEARKAIEQGAPKDAVIKRLKEKGVEGGL